MDFDGLNTDVSLAGILIWLPELQEEKPSVQRWVEADYRFVSLNGSLDNCLWSTLALSYDLCSR